MSAVMSNDDKLADSDKEPLQKAIEKVREAAKGEDTQAIQAFGLDVVTRLCERLLEGGAPGLHIYTLNRAKASRELWKRLM